MPATISDIELQARKLSLARAELKEQIALLEEKTRALRELYRKKLIRLTEIAAAAQDGLLGMVKESPKLFVKPRSVNFYGIKCGFAKGKGALIIDDEDKTIALIQKHFPDLMDTLTKPSISIVKTELDKLPVNDLKRIGVQVKDSVDAAFVKATDSEIDKLVSALMESFCEGSA